MTDFFASLNLLVDSRGVDKGNRKLKGLSKQATIAEKATRSLKRQMAQLGAVLGGTFAVAGLARITDEYRGIENQLRLVTAGTHELRAAQAGTLAVANETGDALKATASLYANLERFAGDFLDGQKEALELTRAINQAALISGASSEAAGRANLQLQQGIAGGILRAEEYNSIVENNARLVEAVAAGLGLSMGQLRQEVIDGLVTSERLIEAIQSQFGVLSTEAESAALTIDRAFTVLGNKVTDIFGRKLEGAQDALVGGLIFIADNLETIIGFAEGAAVALGLMFAPQIIAGAAALVGMVSAISLPLTLAVAGIVGLVAYRDEIAQWATGVGDAGAVVKAAIEVIGGKFQGLFDTIGKFVGKTITWLREWARQALGIFQSINEAAAATAGIFAKAFNQAEIAGVTRQYEGLATQFAAVTAELKEFDNRDPLDKLGRDRQALVDELTALSGDLDTVGTRLNKLVSPVEAGNVVGLYDEIIARAKDIVAGNEDISTSGTDAQNNVTDAATLTNKELDAQADYLEKIANIQRSNTDLRAQSTAGFITDREFQMLVEAQDIEYEIAQLREEAVAAGLAFNETRVRGLLEEEATLQRLVRDQREFARDLEALSGDFASDLLRDGTNAFKNLADNAKNLFLDVLVRPLAEAIQGALSSGLKGLSGIFGQGGGGGLSRFFGGGNPLTSIGQSAAGGFAGFKLGQGFNDLVGNEGNPTSIKAGGAIGGALGLAGGIALNATAFSLLGTSGGLIAGAGGGILGGAAAGSVVPIVGTIIGALLGAILGGVFSKPSDLTGASVINSATGNRIAGPGPDKNAEDNQKSARELTDQITEGSRAINDLIGGAVRNNPNTANNEAFLNVSVRRDRIDVGYQGPTGEPRGGGSFAKDEVGAAEAFEEGVRLFIKSLSGGDDALRATAKSMAHAGAEIEDIADALEAISAISDVGADPVSKYRQAIDDLNDQWRDGLSAAAGIAGAERQLNLARNAAATRLRGQFRDELRDLELQQSGDPLSGFRSLAESAAFLLSDEKALFGQNRGLSLEARAGLFQDFFNQILSTSEGIEAATARFDEFEAVVASAGAGVDALNKGLAAAYIDQAEALNAVVAADISSYLDGPLDRLETLLTAQATRLERAEAVGADIAQVQRLTALEQRQFFEGLSEAATQEISSFLGIFEDASNSVAENLDFSRADLSGRRDQAEALGTTFGGLEEQFANQLSGLTIRESTSALRGRVNTLLGDFAGGNLSAGQALPQVLQQLADAGRTSFGNSPEGAEIISFVREASADAAALAGTIATDADRQIAVLDEGNDILGDIREILQSAEATNALFLSATTGGVGSNTELLQLVQSGLGVAANDNFGAVSVVGLIGQSIGPVFEPLVASIQVFTARLEAMPQLQQATIAAIQDMQEAVVASLDEVVEKLDEMELTGKKQLEQLDEIEENTAA